MSSQDIFCNQVHFGGVLDAEGVSVTMADPQGEIGGEGFMMQSFSANYSRPIGQVTELGPERRTFFTVSRAAGQARANVLVGPNSRIGQFFRKYGNPCEIARNTLSVQAVVGAGDLGKRCGDPDGVCRSTSSEYTFEYCVAGSIDLGFAAQQPGISGGAALTFQKMYESSTSGGIAR